jgi:3-(3-hydroxy-phenyl)propionate hydroxylase
VWRIDWQLPPDADIEAEKRTGDLDKRIRKVIGDVPYEVKWLSTYHFQERIVERFRVGRIFFAGDSAHALPPYGSRGMNSGIQDADNLAWKLAWVLSGRSGPELLDSYHTERYQATQENLRVTGATIRFMQPASAARRWARFILLRAALAAGPFARLVNSGKMAEPFRYVESPVIDQAGDDQLIGAFAPDLTVRAGTGPASTASASTGSANTGSASTGSASTAQADGAPVRLRRYFGAGFVAVHVTDDAVGAASLDQRLSSGSKDLEHVIVLAGGATSANGTGAASGASRVVSCADGGSAAPYRAGYWYLVRPDGHIAASGPAAGLDALADVHARCSGAAEPVGAALA